LAKTSLVGRICCRSCSATPRSMPYPCCDSRPMSRPCEDEPVSELLQNVSIDHGDEAVFGTAGEGRMEQTLFSQVDMLLQRQHAQLKQQLGDCLEINLARQEHLLRQLFVQSVEQPSGIDTMVSSRAPSNPPPSITLQAQNYESDCRVQLVRSETASTACTPVKPLAEEDARRRREAAHVQIQEDIAQDTEISQDKRWRSRLRKFTMSRAFHLLTAMLILTNSVLIGVEVQYTTRNGDTANFWVIQLVFSSLFLIEMVLRLGAEGLLFFQSELWAWNCFDLFLVLLSMLELLIDLVSSSGSSSIPFETSNLRIARFVRIIRSVRIARVVEMLGALRTLVTSLVCTLKTLAWALLLLVMFIYVAGVVFTQAAYDHLREIDSHDQEGHLSRSVLLRQYWGSLGTSMITLFQAISGGVDWDLAARPLEGVHWIWMVLFIAFIAFTTFAVLNVITAVFCQAAIDSAEHDKDMVLHSMIANKKMYEEQIHRLFMDIDRDGSGFITLTELEYRMEDERVKAYLTSLGIDSHDAWTIFKFLDVDGTHRVSFEQFVSGLLRLKGNAKSADMMHLMEENQWIMRQLVALMRLVETSACNSGVPRTNRQDVAESSAV